MVNYSLILNAKFLLFDFFKEKNQIIIVSIILIPVLSAIVYKIISTAIKKVKKKKERKLYLSHCQYLYSTFDKKTIKQIYDELIKIQELQIQAQQQESEWKKSGQTNDAYLITLTVDGLKKDFYHKYGINLGDNVDFHVTYIECLMVFIDD